nr:type VII secretion target [Streptomyces sp. TLI_235]
MSEQISVDPSELRASAATARAIAGEFQPSTAKTTAASRASAGELAGWSIGPALGSLADQWAPALDKTAERLTSTATNLESTAQGHEWNDQQIAETWQQQGAR